MNKDHGEAMQQLEELYKQLQMVICVSLALKDKLYNVIEPATVADRVNIASIGDCSGRPLVRLINKIRNDAREIHMILEDVRARVSI